MALPTGTYFPKQHAASLPRRILSAIPCFPIPWRDPAAQPAPTSQSAIPKRSSQAFLHLLVHWVREQAAYCQPLAALVLAQLQAQSRMSRRLSRSSMKLRVASKTCLSSNSMKLSSKSQLTCRCSSGRSRLILRDSLQPSRISPSPRQCLRDPCPLGRAPAPDQVVEQAAIALSLATARCVLTMRRKVLSGSLPIACKWRKISPRQQRIGQPPVSVAGVIDDYEE